MRKKLRPAIIRCIQTGLILLCSSVLFAKTVTVPQQPQTLNDWIEQRLPTTTYQPHIGIVVKSASTGKTLYEKNANQLFTPASIQKLYIATAALLYLGPSFTFNTTLSSASTIKKGTLEGDAYIHFSGDPYFTSDDLYNLLKQLKQHDIKKIKGTLYLDTSLFDNVAYPPGWLWGDLSYSFAAPLGAANINQNKFLLHLMPAQKIGDPPQLIAELPPEVLSFTNHAITTKSYKKSCPLTVYSDANNHYTIGGCLVKPWKKQRRSLAVRNLNPYIISEVKEALQQQDIAVQSVQFGTIPDDNQQALATYTSEPLTSIVKSMLTQSDNLAADALLKTVGAAYNKQPGTWQNGIHALQDILSAETGIDFHRALLTDGAGLSRYNLTSPEQFAKLLYFIEQQTKIRSELKAALPKPGAEGTLMYRLTNTRSSKRIAAKTGTMTGISSLAGYINTKYNGRVIFVIMVNGFVGPAKKYQRFEDQLCQQLINTKQPLQGNISLALQGKT